MMQSQQQQNDELQQLQQGYQMEEDPQQQQEGEEVGQVSDLGSGVLRFHTERTNFSWCQVL